MTLTGVPELVPARMLNEYAYCPRLFFLEWVDHCGRRAATRPKVIASTAVSTPGVERPRCPMRGR